MTTDAAEDRHQCHTDPGDIDAARHWLRDTMTHHGVATDIQRDLTLAFTEITTNVLPRVVGRPAEDKVELQLAVTPASVRLSVVDASPPFEPGDGQDDDSHDGGMGMLLLHLLADEVSVEPGAAGGSVTSVVKHRSDA